MEWTIPSRDNNKCYAKIICYIPDKERVIGFHVLGPNAGEITQGFAAAIKCGMTKEVLDSTIGIHPVCAEVCMRHAQLINSAVRREEHCPLAYAIFLEVPVEEP
ncbi:hypothetical protein JD844_028509 [Phrynosoma platyrhinos]|uniref:Thioredoxin reductase 1, cytoplasmic n=1 Tax=Phrynosoma platyrhinos TaxID=52577 RepID=A0ABQ7SHY8_PHRPL|nr:hypothetical protein JD844_028509 [Phrynosoma platyrhinos]